MVITTSEKLTPFLAAHEGFVSRAYRCPAGVVTIGYGMTGRSRVFADYWRAKTGRALKMGDTISRAEADAVLTKMLAVEYSPPVARAAPHAAQHAFDGATSVSYNCGPGALKWKWAEALGAGRVGEAAALLRNTAVTANGRRLAGLVRRRKEEAALIEHGDYGHHKADTSKPPPSESTGLADVKQVQGWLKQLGFYAGDIDGRAGPLTIGAVENFQRRHGLVVDGKVGPATRAAMIRAVDAKMATTATVGGGGAATATGAATGGPDSAPGPDTVPVPDATALPDLSVSGEAVFSALGFGAAAVVVIVIAFIIWRNRGRLTGKRVPT